MYMQRLTQHKEKLSGNRKWIVIEEDASGPGEGAFEGDAGGFGDDIGEEAVEEGGAADVGVAVGDFFQCG